MWDRRFLFTDDKIIARLRDFIPVVGNTHDLQNHKSPVGAWFLKAAGKVNPRNLDNETSQGFYVVAADGSGYVFNNNRSVERVLDTLDKGMRGFQAKPPTSVVIEDEKQWTPTPPEGATIVRLYSRIKPAPLGCDDSNANLQRDHLWILPEEMSSLYAGVVPDTLALRLCRFTLVDAIRGEPNFWSSEEVRSKSFSVKTEKDGTLKLTGNYHMETKDGARGLVGKLTIDIARKGEKVTAVKGFADATAWGAGTYTPNPPTGRFPLKFAFILAPGTVDTVAPQAAMIGKEYLSGK